MVGGPTYKPTSHEGISLNKKPFVAQNAME